MSKINLNFNLKGLDGKEIENANAGQLLANLLAQRSDEDSLKLYEIAKKIYEGKPLELDTVDKSRVVSIIKETKEFTNLLKAQLELAFQEK